MIKKKLCVCVGLDQIFGSCQIYKRNRVEAFIKDETVIQIGRQHFWLWFCIESVHSYVLWIHKSSKIEILVTEKFIRSMIQKYLKRTVNSDGRTVYDEACNIMDWNTIYILLREKSNETSQSVFQR
jgi:transposase-like protein